MNLLAIDIGTTTGFAILSDKVIVSGFVSFKPGRHESSGARYLRFRRWLNDQYVTLGKIDEVVYEEVRRHLGTDAAHIYGGLLGQLTAWCEDVGIPYSGVPVGTIKKYATGKGNADKKAMISAAQSWGYQVEDDNQADALALLHLSMTERNVGPDRKPAMSSTLKRILKRSGNAEDLLD